MDIFCMYGHLLVCFAECNIMYVALLASLNNPDERKKGRKYLLIRIFTQIHIFLDIMTKMEFKKLCKKFSRILNTIKSIISTLDIWFGYFIHFCTRCAFYAFLHLQISYKPA